MTKLILLNYEKKYCKTKKGYLEKRSYWNPIKAQIITEVFFITETLPLDFVNNQDLDIALNPKGIKVKLYSKIEEVDFKNGEKRIKSRKRL